MISSILFQYSMDDYTNKNKTQHNFFETMVYY